MKETPNFTLGDFLDLPKDRIKVPGVGVFIPYSSSNTKDFPIFIDKTAEAQRRNRVIAYERMIKSKSDK